MTILIASDLGAISGGAEKVAVTSASLLARAGHDVKLLVGRGPVPEEIAATPNLEVFDLEIPGYYGGRTSISSMRRALWNSAAGKAASLLVENLDPSRTIAHFHNCNRLLTGAVYKEILDAGIPSTFTFHGYALACPSGVFYNFPQKRICELRPFSMACRFSDCLGKGMLNKFGIVANASLIHKRAKVTSRVKNYVSVSQFTADVMAKHLHPKAKIHVVRNPVDVAKGPRVDVAANRDFVWIGRLVAEKDPELFATAASNANVPAVLIGDGPEADAVRAANAAATITGWVGRDDVSTRTRAGRALVMTSRWYEAAPLVIFDALALGLPCVVPDTCAGKEFLIDSETGLIFRSGDREDLADKLRALQDDALVTRMSRAAYERFWSDPPTSERHVESLLGVYEAVRRDPWL